MSTSEPGEERGDRYERLVRRLYDEAYSRGEYAVLEELFAPEYGGVGNSTRQADSSGPEVARSVVERFRTAFPDLRFDVRDVFVDGNTAVAHLAATGTHDGPWSLGVEADPFVAEPTGTAVEFGGLRSFRFDAGRVVESYGYGEWLDVAIQLGFAGDLEDYARSRRS